MSAIAIPPPPPWFNGTGEGEELDGEAHHVSLPEDEEEGEEEMEVAR